MLLVVVALIFGGLAQAQGITSCTAVISGADGTPRRALRGFGDTEASARMDASRAAELLASIQAQVPQWSVLMGMKPSDAFMERQMGAVEQLAARAPGVDVTLGECTSLPADPSVEQAAWTASQGEHSVVRSSPAVAMQAVRRRACLSAYSAQIHAVFESAARAAEDEKLGLYEDGEGSAIDALAQCFDATPKLAPAEGATTLDERLQRPHACRTISLGDARQFVLSGLGVGPSLEAAREDVLWERLRVMEHRSLGAAWSAYGTASPDTRSSLVARAFYEGRAFVGPQDTGEQWATVCREREAGPGMFVWQPGPTILRKCGMAQSRVEHGDRDEMCWGRWTETADMTHRALLKVPQDQIPYVYAAGVSMMQVCAADCRMKVHTGDVRHPVSIVAGEPQYLSQKVLKNMLAEAAESGDFAPLYGLFPVAFQIKAASNMDQLTKTMTAALDAGQLSFIELGGRFWIGM